MGFFCKIEQSVLISFTVDGTWHEESLCGWIASFWHITVRNWHQSPTNLASTKGCGCCVVTPLQWDTYIWVVYGKVIIKKDIFYDVIQLCAESIFSVWDLMVNITIKRAYFYHFKKINKIFILTCSIPIPNS